VGNWHWLVLTLIWIQIRMMMMTGRPNPPFAHCLDQMRNALFLMPRLWETLDDTWTYVVELSNYVLNMVESSKLYILFYTQHSCSPNVFVQNVFVDTHDIRFPWVCFFAFKHIRAGTELTWDYNYDVGSVPDRTMYCYCNSPDCRGRLL